jgi:hypothetical protein
VSRLIIFAVMALSSCALPSSDGPRDDARATLMRYLQAWDKADHATLYDLMCRRDQELIERVKSRIVDSVRRANDLGVAHDLVLLDERAILAQLVGRPDQSIQGGIPTRFALSRLSVRENASDGTGVSIGSWDLEMRGAEYYVCLSSAARGELKRLETDLVQLAEKLTDEGKGRVISIEGVVP